MRTNVVPGLGRVECKNDTEEVWEIISHVQRYMIRPKNEIAPRTIPGSREFERIEVLQLYRSDCDGIVILNIFSQHEDYFVCLCDVLEGALTEPLGLSLQIMKETTPHNHIRIEYKHTRKNGN